MLPAVYRHNTMSLKMIYTKIFFHLGENIFRENQKSKISTTKKLKNQKTNPFIFVNTFESDEYSYITLVL